MKPTDLLNQNNNTQDFLTVVLQQSSKIKITF